MKYYVLPVIFLCFFLTMPAFSAKKMRIAVMDVKPEGVPGKTAKVISNMIRNELINTQKFIVIERAQMDMIFKEQGLQQTGCTDQEFAVEMGRLLSARKILIGEVNSVAAV